MSQFSLNKLPKKERIRLIGEFYNAFSKIRNREEAANIFRDILDGNEIGNIMRRIDIAILLKLGFTYEEIIKLLRVGRDKISRVQRKLQRGGEGYGLLISRILEKRKKRSIQLAMKRKKLNRMEEKPDIEDLKKRYSGPFLLWNLIDALNDHFEARAEQGDLKRQARKHYQNRQARR